MDTASKYGLIIISELFLVLRALLFAARLASITSKFSLHLVPFLQPNAKKTIKPAAVGGTAGGEKYSIQQYPHARDVAVVDLFGVTV